MKKDLKKEKKITIKVLNGPEGKSIYINDFRIADNKPWGGGELLYTFKTTEKLIKQALSD